MSLPRPFEESPDTPAADFSEPTGEPPTPAVTVTEEERKRLDAILAASPPRKTTHERPPRANLPPRKKRPRGRSLANLPMRAKCVELRVEGYTYARMAEELGISTSMCHQHVERWIAEQVPTADRTEEIRQVMMERLETLHNTYWRAANGLPQWYTRKNGERVLGPAAPPNENCGAILLKIMDRQAKVAGVDLQPNTTVVQVTAEAIASFLGWDQDSNVEIIDVEPTVQQRIEAHPMAQAHREEDEAA